MLVKALTRHVEETLALKLPLDAFRPGELRAHLSMNFRLLDEHGGTLAFSRSLGELRAQYGERVTQSFAKADVAASVDAGSADDDLSGLVEWSFGEMPELLDVTVAGRKVTGFPALVDEGDSVSLRAFDTEEKAHPLHQAGLRRLFSIALKEQVRYIDKSLPGMRDIALRFVALGNEKELKDQLLAATLGRVCMMEPLPRNKAEFEVRVTAARSRFVLIAQEIARLVDNILIEHQALLKKLATAQKAFPLACADIGAQVAQLMSKRFIVDTEHDRLSQYPRYLKAAVLRLDKLRTDVSRDVRWMSDWQGLAKPFEREFLQALRNGSVSPFMPEFRWLLEELRVALFAQELRTPSPVSVKRLQKMWDGRPR